MVNARLVLVATDVYDDGCLRVEYPNYFVACKGQLPRS